MASSRLGEELLPPYGPTKGMLQGIHLLQRLTPARVDNGFLRANGVAPGNEYKVVGALHYLGLIDEEGQPTEACRILKTRGPTLTLALQEMIRNAYHQLFAEITSREMTRDYIYNHFVREKGMGAEMATKAARFFIELCRETGIELAAHGERGRRRTTEPHRRSGRMEHGQPAIGISQPQAPPLATSREAPLPLVLAVTPETAALSEDELAELFRKMWSAWRRAQV